KPVWVRNSRRELGTRRDVDPSQGQGFSVIEIPGGEGGQAGAICIAHVLSLIRPPVSIPVKRSIRATPRSHQAAATVLRKALARELRREFLTARAGEYLPPSSRRPKRRQATCTTYACEPSHRN